MGIGHRGQCVMVGHDDLRRTRLLLPHPKIALPDHTTLLPYLHVQLTSMCLCLLWAIFILLSTMQTGARA